MNIAIKVPVAVQVRRLAEKGLDATDIAKLTGWEKYRVEGALKSGQRAANGKAHIQR